MQINYTYQDISFQWDSQKASTNLKDHNVSFEEACEAFLDPFVQVISIHQRSGETREAILGMTTNWKLLYVAYTVKSDEIFRIISARKATGLERLNYEE